MLLIDNARPRPMFLCFLLGRMGMALTVGLLDVFVLQADTIFDPVPPEKSITG